MHCVINVCGYASAAARAFSVWEHHTAAWLPKLMSYYAEYKQIYNRAVGRFLYSAKDALIRNISCMFLGVQRCPEMDTHREIINLRWQELY